MAHPDQARKIAEKLEEACCKEHLLVNKRIKLCELAANLYERASSMPTNELHRTVQPLQEEGINLPMPLQLKIASRRCMETLDGKVDQFLAAWCPWLGEDEAEIEEFDPTNPRFFSLLAVLSDKEVSFAEECEDMTEDQKIVKRQELDLEWKARPAYELKFLPVWAGFGLGF